MDYFISDMHFMHTNIIKLSNRPFPTIEEHDAQLIKNWNQRIEPNDTVYILGDIAMSNDIDRIHSLLDALHGKKRLIAGNHDKYLKSNKFDRTKFEWIKDYYEFKVNKKHIILFHYPILEWHRYYVPSIHLYGHVHNTNINYFDDILPANAVNVGVDVNDFKPLTIMDIEAIIDSRIQNGKNLSYN